MYMKVEDGLPSRLANIDADVVAVRLLERIQMLLGLFDHVPEGLAFLGGGVEVVGDVALGDDEDVAFGHGEDVPFGETEGGIQNDLPRRDVAEGACLDLRYHGTHFSIIMDRTNCRFRRSYLLMPMDHGKNGHAV